MARHKGSTPPPKSTWIDWLVVVVLVVFLLVFFLDSLGLRLPWSFCGGPEACVGF
ncbi:MAG: hypothetical protein QNJ88_07850 [Acidimicrobiia bacterium]|nr:hypothetical protein [Acidimicrobiia bacterium]